MISSLIKRFLIQLTLTFVVFLTTSQVSRVQSLKPPCEWCEVEGQKKIEVIEHQLSIREYTEFCKDGLNSFVVKEYTKTNETIDDTVKSLKLADNNLDEVEDNIDKAKSTYEEAKSTYEEAKSTYEEAESAYERAESAYERAESAYRRAESAYRRAKSTYEEAESAYRRAKSTYGEAKNNFIIACKNEYHDYVKEIESSSNISS